MKKKILFVCYGAGHVNMLLPLILRALANPVIEVVVLGLTTAGEVLSKYNISFIGFRDLVVDSDSQALQIGKLLATNISQSNGIPEEETISYLGLSFYDLIQKFGREEADRQYKERGRQAFLPTIIMRRLFDIEKPDLLVSTNAPRAERASFLVARDMNVASICIVDLFAKQEIDWLGEKGFATKVCVLSEKVKEFFVSHGRLVKEIIVTGNPAFDGLARPELAVQSENFRQQMSWKNKKVILWASQPEPEYHPFSGDIGNPELPRQVENYLFEALEKHSDWLLVIRYHPGENIYRTEYPTRVHVSSSEDDLAVLLMSVDVVLTMTSTVGIEGSLLGKPLVTVDQSIFRKDAPYSEMGLSKGVDDLSQLESVLSSVLTQGWLPKVSLPPVGYATTQIYDHMMGLLLDKNGH